jgi:hypothetical protein
MLSVCCRVHVQKDGFVLIMTIEFSSFQLTHHHGHGLLNLAVHRWVFKFAFNKYFIESTHRLTDQATVGLQICIHKYFLSCSI